MSSSARDSKASAILRRARCLSDGVESRQSTKAFFAAFIATSISAASDTAAVA